MAATLQTPDHHAPNRRLVVEFHCHTLASPDSLVRPEALIAACRRKGIQRVVITDHNTIAGARLAQRQAPEMVIVGEEIMTQEGELLAAFVEEEIPGGLPAAEALDRLEAQGALVSVSHPFDAWRSGGWQQADLEAIADRVDAIEVFNARCMQPEFNDRAAAFAKAHGLQGTAGSDAHSLWELGRAQMVLPPFVDAESMRAALPQASFHLRASPPWIHITSRWAKWMKRLGWAPTTLEAPTGFQG